MSESASVEVLRAEVRVLQVGNGQITRSMYRQLDEANPEQFDSAGSGMARATPGACWSGRTKGSQPEVMPTGRMVAGLGLEFPCWWLGSSQDRT
jgi:hypothetical protein